MSVQTVLVADADQIDELKRDAVQVAESTIARAEATVSPEQSDATAPDPCRLVDSFA